MRTIKPAIIHWATWTCEDVTFELQTTDTTPTEKKSAIHKQKTDQQQVYLSLQFKTSNTYQQHLGLNAAPYN